MKLKKQLASLILTFAFVFVGFISATDIVSAAESEGYTYTIKIILGGTGEEGASFVNSDGDCLKFSGLEYGQTFTFNPKDEVKITPKTTKDEAGNEAAFSKYYVKGMRRSGANDAITESAFKVTQDETFVIAYGVGSVVPYVVRFVDGSGNPLLADATYYGAAGEQVSVPSRYIDGYTPDKLNETIASLKENQIVTFTYARNTGGGGGGTIYNTSERVNYRTVQGEGNQVTQTVPAGQAENAAGVTNNRNQNAGQNPQTPNAAQDEAGNAGAADAEADVDEIQIGDTEVPLAGEDTTTIPDDETPKGGEENNPRQINYFRYLIILILIAIFIILMTLIGIYKVETEKRRRK